MELRDETLLSEIFERIRIKLNKQSKAIALLFKLIIFSTVINIITIGIIAYMAVTIPNVNKINDNNANDIITNKDNNITIENNPNHINSKDNNINIINDENKIKIEDKTYAFEKMGLIFVSNRLGLYNIKAELDDYFEDTTALAQLEENFELMYED